MPVDNVNGQFTRIFMNRYSIAFAMLLASLSGCTSLSETDSLFGYQVVTLPDFIETPTPEVADTGLEPTKGSSSLASPEEVKEEGATPTVVSAKTSPQLRKLDEDQYNTPIIVAAETRDKKGIFDLPQTADGRNILPPSPQPVIISIEPIRTALRDQD